MQPRFTIFLEPLQRLPIRPPQSSHICVHLERGAAVPASEIHAMLNDVVTRLQGTGKDKTEPATRD
jgi:hypothetical protein